MLRICPPPLAGKTHLCSCLTTWNTKNTKQKRREQTEGGHYRPLSSHALCHIRNCSHRVNPARSTARLNGVKKDTKKRKTQGNQGTAQARLPKRHSIIIIIINAHTCSSKRERERPARLLTRVLALEKSSPAGGTPRGRGGRHLQRLGRRNAQRDRSARYLHLWGAAAVSLQRSSAGAKKHTLRAEGEKKKKRRKKNSHVTTNTGAHWLSSASCTMPPA